MECCDDSGHKVIFSGSVPVTEDHTASYSFCASEKKPRNCLKLWLNHLLLSAKYPEYTATVCQFEDQEFKLEAVEQKKAKAKLLQHSLAFNIFRNHFISFRRSAMVMPSKNSSIILSSFSRMGSA